MLVNAGWNGENGRGSRLEEANRVQSLDKLTLRLPFKRRPTLTNFEPSAEATSQPEGRSKCFDCVAPTPSRRTGVPTLVGTCLDLDSIIAVVDVAPFRGLTHEFFDHDPLQAGFPSFLFSVSHRASGCSPIISLCFG